MAEELPDSAYLYTSDSGEKKLPYKKADGSLDWDRIPLAVAAVTVGYRGQVVDLPMEERKKIARKLLRLYRENDKEPPESLLKFLGENSEETKDKNMENIEARVIKDVNNVIVQDINESQRTITCLLHHAGQTANNVYYDSSVLEQNYHKWNGVKCFIDHDINSPYRSVRDLVGIFNNVEYRNGEIIGKLYILPHYDWVVKSFNALKQINETLALSSVLYVDGEFDQSRKVFQVKDIDRVESVDIVTEGATKARLLEINSKLIGNGGKDETQMENQLENQKVNVSEKEEKPVMDVNVKDMTKIANRNLLALVAKDYNTPNIVLKMIERWVEEADKLLTYDEIEKRLNELTEEFSKDFNEYSKNYNYSNYAIVEKESAEKLHHALEGFFKDENVGGVQRFTSFREFYETVTGDKHITGRIENCDKKRLAHFLMKDVNSITTDDFANVLSNYLNRRLVEEYNANLLELGAWRQLVDVVPVRDFRTQYRVRFGGYGDLPKVAQGQPYTGITEVTDEQVTYAVEKRGGTEDLTLETIANDDVGFIRRIPVRLARAAARTLYKFVFNTLIFDNNTIYDGLMLFDDHSVPGVASTVPNYGTAPTSYAITHIRDARVAMLKYPEINSGERLGIVPRYLLVPPDLEDYFYGMLGAERFPRLSGTANTENFPPNDRNWATNWGLTVIVNKFATSSSRVVLVADKRDIPVIEIGFWSSEEPTIVVQDRPDVGSMFAADKITYKIRHVYGGAVLDWRAFYGYV